jgi:hypothetical protein
VHGLFTKPVEAGSRHRGDQPSASCENKLGVQMVKHRSTSNKIGNRRNMNPVAVIYKTGAIGDDISPEAHETLGAAV